MVEAAVKSLVSRLDAAHDYRATPEPAAMLNFILVYHFIQHPEHKECCAISVVAATTESCDATFYHRKALIESMEQLSRREVIILKLFVCYNNLDFELWLYWNDEIVVSCEMFANDQTQSCV